MGSEPPPAPHWSPDRLHWWTGVEWTKPPRSPDGQYFWSGPQWIADPWHEGHVDSTHELATLLKVVIVGVIVVAAYLAWHTYMYRNCLFAPNVFEWPSSCL
jgi:hypothetical protein